jgi:phosphoribosyl-ATP pyrophosphohydrolase/phosphoribosyl-AMP cyclohydrolase|uniref:Histidine biosynthesis bifunctional protein HisIE n=1 Tax=candidate division WOR-3 bacterium TaxID=2052148 RepID=A0A7V3VTL1_UNCW3
MVIGSIDLMENKVVQLRRGREKVLEYDDAVRLAEEFNRYNEVAVIDLDSAMEKGDNFELIEKLIKIADCRVGGGIRTVEKAKRLIELGANKIIVGSKVFDKGRVNHRFLQDLKKEIGPDRIVVALDTFEGKIVIRGWQERLDIGLFDILEEIEPYTNEFLFTIVEKEGMMQGIDMEMIIKIRNRTKKKMTVAGGVSSLDEIKKLAQMDIDVQLGMALYTNKISLVDAFIESLNWKSELLPTVVQDKTGVVLMLAYSNKESLKKTFETGRMWYFSRSRKELWLKGRTSKNFQEVIKLRADCDRDAILAIVNQNGVACHTGNFSCFNTRRYDV